MSERDGDVREKDAQLALLLLAEGSPSIMSWEKAEGLVRDVETLPEELDERSASIIAEYMIMAGYTPWSLYRRITDKTPTGPLSLHVEGLGTPTEIESGLAERWAGPAGLLEGLEETEDMDAAVVEAMAKAGYERISYFAKTGTIRPER